MVCNLFGSGIGSTDDACGTVMPYAGQTKFTMTTAAAGSVATELVQLLPEYSSSSGRGGAYGGVMVMLLVAVGAVSAVVVRRLKRAGFKTIV